MKKLLYNILLPLAFVAILLWSVIGVSQFRPFFSWQYQKLGTAEHIGISQGDLMQVTDGLLSYMAKGRENLEMQFEVKGKMREIFDQREKLHMVDVQNLYMGVIYIAAAISAFVALAFAYLLKTEGLRGASQALKSRYKYSAVGLGLVAGLAGFAIATNFQTFWTNFHLIFFTNDLWLLDPRVSIMINMFPLEFFYAICTTILVVFVAGCIGVYLLLRLGAKKGKERA